MIDRGSKLLRIFFRFTSHEAKLKMDIVFLTYAEVSASWEEKNKEILDSIYYARRIQQSLLPTEKYNRRTLKRLNA